MKARVRLSAAAKRDFDRLYDFGTQFWSERRVETYLRQLNDACQRLSGNPRLGRRRSEFSGEVRSLVHREHVIFYAVVSPDKIVILRVMHGRVQPPEL